MATIKFASGLTIETFPPPHKGFDPLTATREALIKHGFPLRPENSPERLRAWEARMIMLRDYTIVEAQFKQSTNISNGLRLTGPTATTSPNWSGVELPVAVHGQAYQEIESQFIVPTVKSPQDGQSYRVACWAGIDGDQGASGLVQAGVSCVVTTHPGGAQDLDIYAWLQWVPDAETRISNLTVSQGDAVFVRVATVDSTHANIQVCNDTSRTCMFFKPTAPSGGAIQGVCAEWIVERPTVNGQPSLLPDYGTVDFTGAIAFDNLSGGTLREAGSGATIDMVDGSGTSLSTAQILSSRAVRCTFIAAAR